MVLLRKLAGGFPMEKLIPRACDRGICLCVERMKRNNDQEIHELFYRQFEECFNLNTKKPRVIRWQTVKDTFPQ